MKNSIIFEKMKGYTTALNIFQFVHNFIGIKHNRQSPAILESITYHIWNWSELLRYHFQLLLRPLAHF